MRVLLLLLLVLLLLLLLVLVLLLLLLVLVLLQHPYHGVAALLHHPRAVPTRAVPDSGSR